MADFQTVQRQIMLTAGFVEGAPNEFFAPARPAGWQPKTVKIVFIDGRVVEVNYQVAIQRIIAGVAELLV